MRAWTISVMWLPSVAICSSAMAQQFYVYPARNQSQAEQERDRAQCSTWATQQTGFDPMMPPPSPNYSPPPPGAFGGAALGAIGGAITGRGYSVTY